MHNCACTHTPEDHHLAEVRRGGQQQVHGYSIECWGELAYVINDGKADGFHVAHCDCMTYEPVFAETPA